MKKFYISRNYEDRFTATSKAKMDVEDIAASAGYINIGLPRLHTSSKLGILWTRISFTLGLRRMPSNGLFLGQYPAFNLEKQIDEAKARNNKVVVIVHDLDCLRAGPHESLEPLKKADVIVAHNSKMKSWLAAQGLKQDIRTLGIFDYLTDNAPVAPPSFPDDGIFKICFAGNLGKSQFLNEIELTSTIFRLFGVGFERIQPNKKGVEYIGCFSPSELRYKLASHFGLVWDGVSCETCAGNTGEYLKYIASHKLSMYLSANLPVIVWSESAMAKFVTENKIGITVKNLTDLDKVLSGITRVEYDYMVENAVVIGGKISKGYYLSSVLNTI